MNDNPFILRFYDRVKKAENRYFDRTATVGKQLRRWLLKNLFLRIPWPSLEQIQKAMELSKDCRDIERLNEMERTIRINLSMGAPDDYDSDSKKVLNTYDSLQHLLRIFTILKTGDDAQTALLIHEPDEERTAVMDRFGLIYSPVVPSYDGIGLMANSINDDMAIRASDFELFRCRRRISIVLRAAIEDFPADEIRRILGNIIDDNFELPEP